MSEYIVEVNGQMPDAIYERELTEIVRCRDCKYYRFIDRSDVFHDDRHNDSYCLRFVDGKRMEVESSGFCAWGERCEHKSTEVWNQWSVDDVTCSEES